MELICPFEEIRYGNVPIFQRVYGEDAVLHFFGSRKFNEGLVLATKIGGPKVSATAVNTVATIVRENLRVTFNYLLNSFHHNASGIL